MNECRCSECFAEPVCTDDEFPIGACCDEMRQMIRVVRKHFADADKMARWISVEERLPEEGMSVLCYYEYFRYGDYNCMFECVDRGFFLNGTFGGISGSKVKVKYWMPLPQPPEVQS